MEQERRPRMKKLLVLLMIVLLCGCSAPATNMQGKQEENLGNKDAVLPAPDVVEKEEGQETSSIYNIEEYTIKYIVVNKDGSKEKELTEVSFTLNKLPESQEEIDELLAGRSDKNGKFVAVASYLLALKLWQPTDSKTSESILKTVMNSSIVSAFTNVYKNNLSNFLKEEDCWKYYADSFFIGSKLDNKYTPKEPLNVEIRESEEDPQETEINGKKVKTEILIISSTNHTWDKEFTVYKDDSDDNWYVYDVEESKLLEKIEIPE